MSEKRRMDVCVTLLITADIVSAEGSTDVSVVNVANTTMASILPIGEVAESTEEWRNAVATAIVKHGLQFVLNDLAGEHAEPPPKPNVPSGASA